MNMMKENTHELSSTSGKMMPLTVKKSPSWFWLYYGFVSVFLVAVLGFLLCRVVELIDACFVNPLNFIILIISYIATFRLLIKPKSTKLTIRRFGLAFLVGDVLTLIMPFVLLRF
jgi:uncharacterized membrane protein